MVGVIIQAITGNDGHSYTRQQIAACVRNGLRVQGYVWAFPGAPASSMTSRLALFNGAVLEALWLDVEQAGLKVTDVDRDLALCDAYTGTKTGLYSGRWFFAQQGWLGLTKWSKRPLWESLYNHIPVVGAGFVPYAGWTKPAVSQYSGTSSIGSVHQIDLDVE